MNTPLLITQNALCSTRRSLAFWLLAAVCAATILAATVPVHAQGDAITLFKAQRVGAPGDGSPLFEGSDGNFYGAGSSIFRLTPEGVATAVATVPGAGAVLLGHDGNLYGTNSVPNGAGNTPTVTVFQVTMAGQVKTIATIPPSMDIDGNDNVGPLVEDAAGNFYGALTTGGALGNGAIFKVAPDGTVSVVHAFSNIDNNNVNTDGWEPYSDMAIDAVGNVYGLTSLGGSSGNGTIYEISAGGTFSAIYSFAANEQHDVYAGSIAAGSPGTLYFPVSYSSSGSSSTSTIGTFVGGSIIPLYTFTDGGGASGVTLAADGNLYGGAATSDPLGPGITFRLSLDGHFTVLYAAGSFVPPTLGSDGNLYGENSGAGQYFYRLESTLVPAISSATTLTLPQGTPVSYQIVGSNGPILRYSADNLPDKLSLDTATGLINGTPLVGTYTFDVGADNADGTGYATVALTVTAPLPDVPVITAPATALLAKVGKPFSYQIAASYMPRGYTAKGLPKGLTVDPKTGLIHGTAANFGKFLVEIQAANASGTGMASFEIEVAPAALPVVKIIDSRPNADAASGQAGEVTVTLSAASGIDLVVDYTVRGSAEPGVDYQRLPGTIKLKAGMTHKSIKIVPKDDRNAASDKIVKIVLQHDTGYTLGTPDSAKVKIVKP